MVGGRTDVEAGPVLPARDLGALPVRSVPIEAIGADPDQPRKTFAEEALGELARSLLVNGVAQPLLLRPNPNGDGPAFLIVFGERRFRAAQRAGLATVPAKIAEDLSPVDVALLQLDENDQREDLTLLERASGYARALDLSGLPQKEFASRHGLNRSTLSTYQSLAHAAGHVLTALEADLLRDAETARLYSKLPPELQYRLLVRAKIDKQPLARNAVRAAAERLASRADRTAVEADPRPGRAATRLVLKLEHQQLAVLLQRLGLAPAADPAESIAQLLAHLAEAAGVPT